MKVRREFFAQWVARAGTEVDGLDAFWNENHWPGRPKKDGATDADNRLDRWLRELLFLSDETCYLKWGRIQGDFARSLVCRPATASVISWPPPWAQRGRYRT